MKAVRWELKWGVLKGVKLVPLRVNLWVWWWDDQKDGTLVVVLAMKKVKKKAVAKERRWGRRKVAMMVVPTVVRTDDKMVAMMASLQVASSEIRLVGRMALTKDLMSGDQMDEMTGAMLAQTQADAKVCDLVWRWAIVMACKLVGRLVWHAD